MRGTNRNPAKDIPAAADCMGNGQKMQREVPQPRTNSKTIPDREVITDFLTRRSVRRSVEDPLRGGSDNQKP
jgi:hypothetical protein